MKYFTTDHPEHLRVLLWSTPEEAAIHSFSGLGLVYQIDDVAVRTLPRDEWCTVAVPVGRTLDYLSEYVRKKT